MQLCYYLRLWLRVRIIMLIIPWADVRYAEVMSAAIVGSGQRLVNNQKSAACILASGCSKNQIPVFTVLRSPNAFSAALRVRTIKSGFRRSDASASGIPLWRSP